MERGFYVEYIGDGPKRDHYLQKDLTLFFGVNGPSGGFWETEEKAKEAVRKFTEITSMNKKEWVEQWVCNFLSSLTAKYYDKFCIDGRKEDLYDPPVEDAYDIAEEQWNKLYE